MQIHPCRTRRAALGLSQTELGKKAGCHYTTIGAIERGRPVKASTIHRVAAVLDAEPREILADSQAMLGLP